MSCTTTWTTWWLLALVFTCLWLMLKWDKLASVYWGHVPHARHLCSGIVLKNSIPWDSIARHCPGKEKYRKIHPKWLCNIDSVKFNTSLSENGTTNTKMMNMKETLNENSIGYRPPLRRKFVNKFWTVPLIVWQKILLICSNILPPIFHTTNLANISCEILFWIIIFSYSKMWQEKSNFLKFRRPCDICKPMWHCHEINEIAVGTKFE